MRDALSSKKGNDVKRSLPRLFNGLAALSLLLCATTCALWVRSYFHCDHLVWWTPSAGERDAALSEVAVGRGRFVAVRHSTYADPAGPVDRFEYTCGPASDVGFGGPDIFGRMGFSLVSKLGSVDSHRSVFDTNENLVFAKNDSEPSATEPRHRGIREFLIGFPLWFPTMLFAALATPTLTAIWRLLYNRPSGTCRICGYDLCGTPDRCPECGTITTTDSRKNNLGKFVARW